MKLGRTYRLEVEIKGNKHVVIEPPYTLEFNIVRNNLAKAQTGVFTIYNLTETDRERLYKDRFDTTRRVGVKLWAGYEGNCPVVFNGTVSESYSDRTGVDFKTVIQAYDGAFPMMNAFSNITLGNTASVGDVLRNLNTDLVIAGMATNPIVGNYPSRFQRHSVYVGNTWKYVVQLTNGLAIVDNNRLIALNSNEAIESALIQVITAQSGLLGVPRRSETNVVFPMLFEPRLTVGQIVHLESFSSSMFNGTYKVCGLSHSGTISPVSSAPCVTEVQLWKGESVFKTIPGVTV